MGDGGRLPGRIKGPVCLLFAAAASPHSLGVACALALRAAVAFGQHIGGGA